MLCVFVALGIRHAMHMRHIVLSSVAVRPVRLYNTFRPCLINGTILEKINWPQNVQLLFERFLVLRTTERDVIINAHIYMFKYSTVIFLSDFNETWLHSTDFRKILQYKISRPTDRPLAAQLFHARQTVHWQHSCSTPDRPSTGSTAVPREQTDMTKLIVAFRHFSSAPKICTATVHIGKIAG